MKIQGMKNGAFLSALLPLFPQGTPLTRVGSVAHPEVKLLRTVRGAVLWTAYLCPCPNLYDEDLTCSKMVLGGGAFRR